MTKLNKSNNKEITDIKYFYDRREKKIIIICNLTL